MKRAWRNGPARRYPPPPSLCHLSSALLPPACAWPPLLKYRWNGALSSMPTPFYSGGWPPASPSLHLVDTCARLVLCAGRDGDWTLGVYATGKYLPTASTASLPADLRSPYGRTLRAARRAAQRSTFECLKCLYRWFA